MQHSDVIIIGAGVIGSSIAYQLSCRGIKNTLVLDSGNAPGQGSTSKATGGFRSQFGSEMNIQLSLLARQKLLDFKDEHGIDPGYLQAGYLFLAQTNEEMKNLTLANSLQQKNGVKDAILVSSDDIRKLNPHINMQNITGGSFCRSDGFIEPMNILNGYVSSSQSMGVKYIYNEQVTKLNCIGSKMDSIETPNGKFSADLYVNAAGAWAGSLAGLALEYLPVKHLKRQVCRIKEKNTFPADTPMTIWVNSGFHFRMKDDHLILLYPCVPENNYNYDVTLEASWLDKVMAIAKQNIPAANVLNADFEGSWAGLYEMSPDEHLILGRSDFLENFYYANGASGHGVMHSPAIGELLANIICNKPNEIDVDILSPKRFTERKFIEQIHFF
ncbi:MAG: FAD-binding oxidoreductase [Ignavibacteria bacterium]